MENRIYILTGPTAVGKTALALDWAQMLNAEIISCDSLLFYRGMDIGTAKPTKDELSVVRHHLIDIVPVSEQLSIKAYLDRALAAAADIFSRGKQVLVTGGSGFYLKAFLEPVVDSVKIPEHVSQEVSALYAGGDLAPLIARLSELNPEGLADLDVENPRRVTKALERCLASGKTLKVLKAEFLAQPSPFAQYAPQVCLLQRSPDVLWDRVCQRVDAMFEAGLLEEVKGLLDQGIEKNASGRSAIGYREVIEYFENGDDDVSALKEKIAINTRKLIAKQRKWFRNQIKSDFVLDLDAGTPECCF